MWLRLLFIALAAMGITTLIVAGTVTYFVIKRKMEERKILKAAIINIDRCTNTIKLKDLNSYNTLEIKGDSISSDLSVNQIIEI